jgi:hypothetical protein
MKNYILCIIISLLVQFSYAQALISYDVKRTDYVKGTYKTFTYELKNDSIIVTRHSTNIRPTKLLYSNALNNEQKHKLTSILKDFDLVKMQSKYIHKTDSLAVSILKTYDENSKRLTGVPLSIEHYDKIFSFNAEQNNVLVSYSFNKIKFFGPTGIEVIVEDIDKYPYRFDIIYDFETNKAYSQFTDPNF